MERVRCQCTPPIRGSGERNSVAVKKIKIVSPFNSANYLLSRCENIFLFSFLCLLISTNLSLLCNKITSTPHQAPIYLLDLLHLCTPFRQIRSSKGTPVFTILSFRIKRSEVFALQPGSDYMGPSLCFCPSCYMYLCPFPFRSFLKTFLFSKNISPVALHRHMYEYGSGCVCVCVCVCV